MKLRNDLIQRMTDIKIKCDLDNSDFLEFKWSIWSFLEPFEKMDCYGCKTTIRFYESFLFVAEIDYRFICETCHKNILNPPGEQIRQDVITLSTVIPSGFRIKKRLTYYICNFEEYYLTKNKTLKCPEYIKEFKKYLEDHKISFTNEYIAKTIRDLGWFRLEN